MTQSTYDTLWHQCKFRESFILKGLFCASARVFSSGERRYFLRPRIKIISAKAMQDCTSLTSLYIAKTCHDLVTSVFPRFKQLAVFYFEFSFVSCEIYFILSGCCDHLGFVSTKRSKKTKKSPDMIILEFLPCWYNVVQ